MKSVNSVNNLSGKKVLVRLDLDVPVEKGVVGDKTRLEAALPTLRYLLEQKATVVILGQLGLERKVLPIRMQILMKPS